MGANTPARPGLTLSDERSIRRPAARRVPWMCPQFGSTSHGTRDFRRGQAGTGRTLSSQGLPGDLMVVAPCGSQRFRAPSS